MDTKTFRVTLCWILLLLILLVARHFLLASMVAPHK
jgi:hypothetical protein